jgi:hypothetical protein
MMGATIHDHDGKVVARSPGIDDPNASEDLGFQRLISENEAHRRGIAVTGLIDPARRVIQAEHPVEERDLLPLMKMSPFVPPGRELIFARAFARFFGGDFMTAVHSVPVCEVMGRAAARDWDGRGGGASGGSRPG